MAGMIPQGGPSLTLQFQAEFDKRCLLEIEEMLETLNKRLASKD